MQVSLTVSTLLIIQVEQNECFTLHITQKSPPTLPKMQYCHTTILLLFAASDGAYGNLALSRTTGLFVSKEQ